MCFLLSSVLTFGRLLCSAGRCCLSLSRGGCLLVSDSVPLVWESYAVGFGLSWLKVFWEIAHGQLRPGNGIGESTGKVIWCLGFLLARISEPFLPLGEKAVNRTNAPHNGVLTCFSSLAVVTPRKTGTSLSWATQTGSPLPQAVCDAERGFFSCCSISTERLDSAVFSSFVPRWERSTYPKCSAALLVKTDPPTPSLPLEKQKGNFSYIFNSLSLSFFFLF